MSIAWQCNVVSFWFMPELQRIDVRASNDIRTDACASNDIRTDTHIVKNGALLYALLGVVEEWSFEHPCLAPFSPAKLQLSAYPHCGQIVSILSISLLCEHAPNCNFAGENGG